MSYTDNLNDFIKEFTKKFEELVRPINEAYKPLSEFTIKLGELVKPINEEVTKLGFALIKGFKPITAAKKLGEAQFVYWARLDEELIDSIISSGNINKFLRELYESNKYVKLEKTISLCYKHPLINRHKRLFLQAIMAFREGKNDISVLRLIAIIDGLFTDVSGDYGTKFMKRAEAIKKKVEKNEEIHNLELIPMILALTFQKTVDSLFKPAPFDKKEPKGLNRHWIMHGHSRRRKTKLDCVKLINFIYGILLINDCAELELNFDG